MRGELKKVEAGSLLDLDLPMTGFSFGFDGVIPVSYTHLRAHETVLDLVCRLLLEKKHKQNRFSHDTPQK